MRRRAHIAKRDLYIGAAVLIALFMFSGQPALAPGQVEAVRTKLTKTQARAYLQAALQAVLGRAPTAAELAMLVAQSAHETGNWAAMWNWNWGNSVVGGSGAQWFALKATPGYKYRDFPSATVGAAYYVNLIKTRFPAAWALLGSGNTTAFAQALYDAHYYTGKDGTTDAQKVAAYAAGLANHYALA